MRSEVSSAGYEISKPAGTSIGLSSFILIGRYLSTSVEVLITSARILMKKNLSLMARTMRRNILYRMKMSKEENFKLLMKRLNATITATDDKILNVELDEDKHLDYELNVHSTGIADLKSKQSGSRY